jgi:hypothetical protein
MLLASPDQPVSQPLELPLPQKKGVIHKIASNGKTHLKPNDVFVMGQEKRQHQSNSPSMVIWKATLRI